MISKQKDAYIEALRFGRQEVHGTSVQQLINYLNQQGFKDGKNSPPFNQYSISIGYIVKSCFVDWDGNEVSRDHTGPMWLKLEARAYLSTYEAFVKAKQALWVAIWAIGISIGGIIVGIM